jgi:hypothetical protein
MCIVQSSSYSMGRPVCVTCDVHVLEMGRLETITSCIVATVVMRDLDTWDSFFMNSFNIWDIPLWDVLSRLCSPLRRFVAGSSDRSCIFRAGTQSPRHV